jgi:hypothetical protein
MIQSLPKSPLSQLSVPPKSYSYSGVIKNVGDRDNPVEITGVCNNKGVKTTGSHGFNSAENPVESPYGLAEFNIYGPQYGLTTSKATGYVPVQMASSKAINTFELPYGVPEFDIYGPQYGITQPKAAKLVDLSYTQVSHTEGTTKSIQSGGSPYGMTGFDLYGPQYGLTASTPTKPAQPSDSQTTTLKSTDSVSSRYGLPGLSAEDDYYNDSEELCTKSTSIQPATQKASPVQTGKNNRNQLWKDIVEEVQKQGEEQSVRECGPQSAVMTTVSAGEANGGESKYTQNLTCCSDECLGIAGLFARLKANIDEVHGEIRVTDNTLKTPQKATEKAPERIFEARPLYAIHYIHSVLHLLADLHTQACSRANTKLV